MVRALPFVGDDAALVTAMIAGRPDAMSAFYDRHVDAVRRLAFRLFGPDAELDDLVHDVFVRALESLPKLRDPGALRPWLLGIVVHATRARIQRRVRQRWLRFFAPEDVPEPSATPDFGSKEALREVYAVLATLPVDERLAFVLVRVEGLSLEDATVACATSFATLRRRVARGEAKLMARARGRPALAGWLEGEAK